MSRQTRLWDTLCPDAASMARMRRTPGLPWALACRALISPVKVASSRARFDGAALRQA